MKRCFFSKLILLAVLESAALSARTAENEAASASAATLDALVEAKETQARA